MHYATLTLTSMSANLNSSRPVNQAIRNSQRSRSKIYLLSLPNCLPGTRLLARMSQEFRLTTPDMVDRLILIDTTPRYTDELRAMWVERAATARSAGVKALVDGLLKIWFTPQSLIDDTGAVRYVRTTLQQSSGEGYALACEALARADLRTAAARITSPTLVICGDEDMPSFLDSARCSRTTSKVRGSNGLVKRATHPLSNVRLKRSRSCASSCGDRRDQPFRCWLKKSSVSFSARSASGLLYVLPP